MERSPHSAERLVLGRLSGPPVQTPGMSAVQFQRQLGLSRYETAFQILHKLRSGMVRPNQDRIGGQPKNHVEVDETWVGGRTRGEGRGVHHKVLVSCCHRGGVIEKPGTKLDNRKDGRYAGRVRLAVVLDRSAESLCGFVESTVAPGSLIVTDDWSGYAGLGKRGYEHFAVAECGDPEVAEQYLPVIHLVSTAEQPEVHPWLIKTSPPRRYAVRGVGRHLQAYRVNELHLPLQAGIFCGFPTFLALVETIALAVHFQDMDMVDEAVKKIGHGQAFARPNITRPNIEGQDRGHQDRAPLSSAG